MEESFRVNSSEISSSFNKLVGDLTSFLKQDDTKVKEFRSITEKLFKCLKYNSGNVGIKDLVVDKFDEEQVWAQIELDNEAYLNKLEEELAVLFKLTKQSKKKSIGKRGLNNRNGIQILSTSNDDDEDENLLEPASSDDDEDVDKLLGSREMQYLSTFEKEQQRIREKIAQLEEENIGDKPWKMVGEVTADKRPENSLLEEHFQYDFVGRPAPVMEEEITTKLEDIIKQRIKDGIWDDVERKTKPAQLPFEYKRRLLLDQEKSKVGLAEVYEKEYLQRKQEDKTEDENEAHKEIRKLMSNLFLQLDSLSSFHFTPKPPEPEIKIINNLPAVSAEEAIPAAVSDATLLAPEEIAEKPKRPIKGDTERDTTDKKRERRLKKKKQKVKSRWDKMKKDSEKISLTNKYNRLEKEKIKKLVKKISSGKEIKL